ncbi:MAG: SAP domain-containing protein [Gammaproteobacteria bacterium]|nr:SAP domain-containing protein [Gammaproteobacteria bacterium]
MKMLEIREIARKMGIKSGRLNKMKLIRTIQLDEGNFDCFGSAGAGECDQARCKWREDCLPAVKKQRG